MRLPAILRDDSVFSSTSRDEDMDEFATGYEPSELSQDTTDDEEVRFKVVWWLIVD